MTINPFILLGIGSFFALLYAMVIIFGWARTRHNRKILQNGIGLSTVPTMVLDSTISNAPTTATIFSLENNTFLDNGGKPIDMASFNCYIAVGVSPEYPGIKDGDLILIDNKGSVKHVFTLPLRYGLGLRVSVLSASLLHRWWQQRCEAHRLP